jgi:hypothetical protein
MERSAPIHEPWILKWKYHYHDNHVIQEVFSIVDELDAIHDNMLSSMELKTCNLVLLH